MTIEQYRKIRASLARFQAEPTEDNRLECHLDIREARESTDEYTRGLLDVLRTATLEDGVPAATETLDVVHRIILRRYGWNQHADAPGRLTVL